MLNPYKRLSVKLEDGTVIKPFETIAQARDRAKWESKMKHIKADIIVNESVFESYDEKGIII